MASMGLSYGNASDTGYWGNVNSHFNFCEEDYSVSHYVAEFVNTFSNLIYVYYAVFDFRQNIHKKDWLFHCLPSFGALGVGIGSILFHATLKYYMQWFDDLSMLLVAAIVFHRLFTWNTSTSQTINFGIFVYGGLTVFSVWHCIVDETKMHSTIFGILLLGIVKKAQDVIKIREEQGILGGPPGSHGAATERDIKRLHIWGTLIFVLGFIFWNMDYYTCDQLNSTRRAVGMPLSFILELHGWWHIFTGIGAYVLGVATAYLCSEDAGKSIRGRYAWPVDLILGEESVNSVQAPKKEL